MTPTRYYINGLGLISPQNTFDAIEFLNFPREYFNNVLPSVLPDFKSYINPNQLRRLSRMLRIGLSSATICLRNAKVEIPDGIITATGYGFLDDTAKFLTEMYSLGEKHLTPTFFMQSTYNALGGLVALATRCNGYNNTYVSKGFAFETALLDSIMRIDDNPASRLLVGAYDETDAVQYAVNSKAGHYKTEFVPSLKLFESHTRGSLQGEGAAFFLLSGERTDTSWCGLDGLKMMYKPTENEFRDGIREVLQNAGPPDVVISGVSGDEATDSLLTKVTDVDFADASMLRFKHLCGEFCTASSFAMWMAAKILQTQLLPEVAVVRRAPEGNEIRTVLILNHYYGRNVTALLLSRLG